MAGRHEVAFYTTRSPPPCRHASSPRCFDAHWDAATDDWHLLLEDLTRHARIATVWPLPPTLEQCERIVAVAGALPRGMVGRSASRRLDRQLARRSSDRSPAAGPADARASPTASAIAPAARATRRCTSGCSKRHRACCSALRTRAAMSRIVHGDAHVWNCFLPRDGGDDVRLFDWDAWRIGVAATDLAYMMAMHWYPDRRRRLERALLDRYHATLLAARRARLRPRRRWTTTIAWRCCGRSRRRCGRLPTTFRR